MKIYVIIFVLLSITLCFHKRKGRHLFIEEIFEKLLSRRLLLLSIQDTFSSPKKMFSAKIMLLVPFLMILSIAFSTVRKSYIILILQEKFTDMLIVFVTKNLER